MAKNSIKILGNKTLRDRMPRGGIQQLARKYNCSWQWAYYVISGKYAGNPDIIRDAEMLASINDDFRKKTAPVINEIYGRDTEGGDHHMVTPQPYPEPVERVESYC